MSILKTGSWQLFWKCTLIIGKATFLLCSSVHFTSRNLITADSPGKFYPLFLSLGSAILEDAKILSGILNGYSKTKISSLRGKRKFFNKNHRKELQNYWERSCLTKKIGISFKYKNFISISFLTQNSILMKLTNFLFKELEGGTSGKLVGRTRKKWGLVFPGKGVKKGN